MSCDKLVFDLSQEVEGSPNVFIKKDWLNILDNQNGQYSSNQSVIDTSQLTNSNRYMSYREGYLAVPMLLSLGTTSLATAGNFDPATAATSADYALGLKNWFGQIVHSLTLDYNGTTIIQQTPYCNMWNSFKLMTSFSWNDVWTQGASIGFYPDDPNTFAFFGSTAAALSGTGTCNNSNLIVSSPIVAGAFNQFTSTQGNAGFLKRSQFINYDTAGDSGSGTYADLFTANACANVWKSFVSSKVNGADGVTQGQFQISVMAVIYLKHLHSFFNSVPLIKGAYMKATLNLNNTSVSFTSSANVGALTINSVSNAVGGVCPLMIASAVAGNGGNCLSAATIAANIAVPGSGTATTYTANISVGAVCLDPTLATFVAQGQLSRSIYLYVPAYTFNPVFESAYLSSPIKQIKYTDIYQYQIVNIQANTGQVNQLITNGIANIKSVLLIAFYTPLAGSANTGLPTGLPVFQSPFDTAGCGSQSPMVQFNNFNVVISGQNIIYNTQQRAYEQFQNQFYGTNAVNGGMTDGLTSGLIDRLGFDMIYGSYYVDVSRMLPVEESVPKSIQIIGTNQSAKAIDIYVFVEYGVDISIDALTGVRV
jgi:hypothetical protein